MFLLQFIPDSWLHLAVISIILFGVGLYVLGIFLNFIPPLLPYKEPIRILGTILMISGVYFYGGYSTEMQWRDKVERLQEAVQIAEVKARETTTLVETKLVTKIKNIHTQGEEIVKYVDREIVKYDNQCNIPTEVVTALNAAALNQPVKENKSTVEPRLKLAMELR